MDELQHKENIKHATRHLVPLLNATILVIEEKVFAGMSELTITLEAEERMGLIEFAPSGMIITVEG